MEATKSYSLDEIIETLEHGQSVASLIFDRQAEDPRACLYITVGRSPGFLRAFPGINFKPIKNPFKDKLQTSVLNYDFLQFTGRVGFCTPLIRHNYDIAK